MVARLRIPLELYLLATLLVVTLCVRNVNWWLEVVQVEEASAGDIGALPDGNTLRIASLGFERLVADLFWIRTVYYVGDPVASKANWPAAERLTRLATDIDPGFDSAYVVMASVLSGLAHDPDAA